MRLEHTNNNNYQLENSTFTTSLDSFNSIEQAELDQTNPAIKELDSSVALFFLWTTIFSIIFLTLVKILQKLEISKMQNWSISLPSSIPCRKCVFFNQNDYLKCAVNPHIVFTKQAINCSHYHNPDEDLTSNNVGSEVQTIVNRDEPRSYS